MMQSADEEVVSSEVACDECDWDGVGEFWSTFAAIQTTADRYHVLGMYGRHCKAILNLS